MAQHSQNRQKKSQYGYSPEHHEYHGYVDGNVVRKPEEHREYREHIEKQRRKADPAVRRNREKAGVMNLGYAFFLACSMAALGVVLLAYISLQWEITRSIEKISAHENTLNEMKLMNDEEYNRIISSTDLEEIKRIAIQELGMQYAQEGQIIVFSGENSDYVRQLADIPE